MAPRITLVLVLFLLPFSLFSQLQIDANFDSGRLDSAYQVSGSLYTLAPHVSVFCRVVGVQDSTPEFRIFDWEGYRLRTDHRMVWSYDGLTGWEFFDNGQKTGSVNWYYFGNNQPFQQDTVYIAYWYPWSYGQQEDFMNQIIGSSPYLRNDSVRGLSIQGRNIWGYEITDTTWPDCFKKHVVWTGRQHPTEFKQSYVTNGFTEYLLYATDPVADSLRKYYVFHIYPMINPDGVYLGIGTNTTGTDPNRSWSPGWQTPGACPETDVMREAVWKDCGGHVDFSIDIHSNAGHRGLYYYFGLKSGPQANEAAALVDAIHYWDSLDHGGAFIINDTILADVYGGTAYTCGNWMNQTMGAVSFTLEPNTLPLDTIGRLKTLGRSVAKGFYQMITSPGPPALQLTGTNLRCADEDSGSVAVTVTGGLTPYAYVWSNGDTVQNLSGLAAGTYALTLTDAQGCTLVDSVVLTQPDSLFLSLSSTPQTLPNSDGTAGCIPTGGTPPYTYAWNDPATQTDSVATGLAQGWYSVLLTDSNGCQISDSVFVDALVSTQEDGFPFEVQIFPQPAQDNLCIKVEGRINERIHAVLYDAVGRKRLEVELDFRGSSRERSLSLHGLPSGLFQLTLETETGQWLHKYVIINR